MADINALLAKVEQCPSVPAVLPAQPEADPARRGIWTRGRGRGRGAPYGRGQSYPVRSERSSPWRQTSSTSDLGQVPVTSMPQSRTGRSPPARVARETARQAGQPYVTSARHPAPIANQSALSAKKGPSTGFIDISSDEEK